VNRVFKSILWALAIVFVSGIALRIEAALVQRQMLTVVSGLSSLRVGSSTKAEALSRIPTIKRNPSGPYGAPVCDADECFSTSIPNSSLSSALLLRVAKTNSRILYSILSWLGIRFWNFEAYVDFSSGRVSYVSYHLMVSTPQLSNSGVVVVQVSSIDAARRGQGNPPYRVSVSSEAPSNSIGIDLTPDAPSEFADRAFQLNLRCLWSFTGCKGWNELLPGIKAYSEMRP
jgi:hypothetical protein